MQTKEFMRGYADADAGRPFNNTESKEWQEGYRDWQDMMERSESVSFCR